VLIDALRLDTARIPLEDGPDGLQIANVSLTLARPMELGVAVWDGAGELAAAEGEIDLNLSWAIAAGDDQLPLASQRIDGVSLRAGLRRRGKQWTAALVLARDGRAWALADLLELSDLRIDVRGPGATDPHQDE
jgi:hypothetical protein